MKKHAAVLFAAAAAGGFAAPGVASATTPLPVVALSNSDEFGGLQYSDIRPGGTAVVRAGVKVIGPSAPGTVVVVKLSVTSNLDLPKSFTNCFYFSRTGAWCSLPDATEVGKSYELDGLAVAAPAGSASPGLATGLLTHQWLTGDSGGAERLASTEGTPVRGTGGVLHLKASTALTGSDGSANGTAGVRFPPPSVPTGPKEVPTIKTSPGVPTKPQDIPDTQTSDPVTDIAKPVPTGSRTTSAAPAAPAPADSTTATTEAAAADTGGLPLTGSSLAPWAGAALMLFSAAGLVFLHVRRRRTTRFVA
ncbi:hypothetical protein [Paractinoplanes durhamensis]|uniref:Uncharacterized protein n=1 Tax=Paractinoplanes durhamensis TaxID=113563 RepID=A0ABQ3Z6Z1_9ACTN|nr:hypothetical protein [Actinoplanes durhamensis]GIE05590.1 hypothetical protein Adu01nite_69400 [Actinoplanes durhamensis]